MAAKFGKSTPPRTTSNLAVTAMMPELSEDQQLALCSGWFFRASQHQRILQAKKAAFVSLWRENVQQVFSHNTLNPGLGGPKTWTDLFRRMHLNGQNGTRYASRALPETIRRYEISAVLGKCDQDLSPTTAHWIAQTGHYLIHLHAPEIVGDLPKKDRPSERAYTAFGLYLATFGWRSSSSLDHESVMAAKRDIGPGCSFEAATVAITQAATFIGRALNLVGWSSPGGGT